MYMYLQHDRTHLLRVFIGGKNEMHFFCSNVHVSVARLNQFTSSNIGGIYHIFARFQIKDLC